MKEVRTSYFVEWNLWPAICDPQPCSVVDHWWPLGGMERVVSLQICNMLLSLLICCIVLENGHFWCSALQNLKPVLEICTALLVKQMWMAVWCNKPLEIQIQNHRPWPSKFRRVTDLHPNFTAVASYKTKLIYKMGWIQTIFEYPSSLGKLGDTSGWKFLSVISSLLRVSSKK